MMWMWSKGHCLVVSFVSFCLKSEILMSLQTLAQLGTAGHGFRQVWCQRSHSMTANDVSQIASHSTNPYMSSQHIVFVCAWMRLVCLELFCFSEDEALDSQCMSGVSCSTKPAKVRQCKTETKRGEKLHVVLHIISHLTYRHVKSGSASKLPCASSASAPRTIFWTATAMKA